MTLNKNDSIAWQDPDKLSGQPRSMMGICTAFNFAKLFHFALTFYFTFFFLSHFQRKRMFNLKGLHLLEVFEEIGCK